MERFLQDLRHAVHTLSKSPGFALIVVLTLALGLGATTAIFTVLDAVVLKPLPYSESERLVRIENRVPGIDPDRNWGLSPAGYFHFLENSRALASLGVYTTPEVSITGDYGPAERVQAATVSSYLLGVLRLRPALGRLITPQDNRTPANATGVLPGPAVPVALLSHELWRNRFGARPDVIGATIEVGGTPVQVVGVLEPGADLPEPGIDVDIWLPLGLNPAAPPVNWHSFRAIGRLDEGVSLAAAQEELARFTSRFVERFPSAYSASFMEETGFAVEVTPLHRSVVDDAAATIWILFAAVGLVLLIACTNVANIFVARTEGRGREMAVRTALGATRTHLARSFLTEGIVLAFLGGAFGLLLAWAGVNALVVLAPAGLPRLDEIHISGSAIIFMLVLATLVGALVGSFPLLRFKSVLASTTLREEGRGSTPGRQGNALRSLLVVGQVAMAVVLLTVAGLLLRSVQQLRAVEPGLDPANVLAMEITLPGNRYDDYTKVSAFYQALVKQINALPGVEHAAVVDDMPFVNTGVCASLSVDEPPLTAAAEPGCIPNAIASPGYFKTLGIPVEGKIPDWNDVDRRRGGVVVSRALAERLWPGEDPIGKGIRGNGSTPPFYRVVGIAGDVHANGLDEAPVEVVYFPLIPLEQARLWGPPRSTTLLVKVQGVGSGTLVTPVRRVLSDLDPDVPVANVRTVERIISESMAQSSFTLFLLGIAAAVALVLGAVGLYGVLSHVVGQRRREIGIRIALGARQERVAFMVLSRSLLLVAGGVLAGLIVTLAVTRVLRSLLFEVSPADPLTLVAVSVILAVVALLASYLPARRAIRVDPIEALRYE